MSLFLAKQPPRPDDRDNPLRLAMLAPLFPGFQEFADRHGMRVYMVYGMTEMPCVFSVLDPADPKSLGPPADPGYQVRLVDEHDLEVERGTPGEMILRHELPWAISPGYLNDPTATAAAWRNGWFHTGDVFVEHDDGSYVLVDRVKDSIRRRGENVSSAEVETELVAHPDVAEAAVIGVPAEMEEEILAYVSFRPGASVTPEALIDHLVPRLPYFALPRFIHVAESLPRNVALRPDKPALRAGGLPDGVWDREVAGKVVRRERFAGSS
jgi:crotonobetaine/carnitine-CoA ligase